MPKGVFTPKRKAFPLHTDMYYWAADPTQSADVLHKAIESGVASVLETVAEDRPLLIHNPKTMYTRVLASWNYLQCHYHVVNALVQTPPGYYVRPAYIMNYLREVSPEYYWPISIVGHLLGAVGLGCKEVYMVDHDYVNDDKLVPVAIGRDSSGRYYVLEPQGGNEGRLWLMRLRRNLYDAAVKAMDADASGHLSEGCLSESSAAGALNGFLPGPTRSKEGFLGNLRPGERLIHHGSI